MDDSPVNSEIRRSKLSSRSSGFAPADFASVGDSCALGKLTAFLHEPRASECNSQSDIRLGRASLSRFCPPFSVPQPMQL